MPTGIYFISIPSFLGGVADTAVPTVVVRGNDTYHYAGSVLFPLRRIHGWIPFLAAGGGAVTRTAEEHLLPPTGPGSISPGTIIFSISTPSPTETDLSLNLGGGVKRFFSDRYGIRFDFRSYTSKVSGDMVDNMEISVGFIFRL